MTLVISPEEALQKAIEAAGGKSELANTLGIKVQSINDWKRCPAERAAAVAKASKGAVTCRQLRPDVFPADMAIPGDAA